MFWKFTYRAIAFAFAFFRSDYQFWRYQGELFPPPPRRTCYSPLHQAPAGRGLTFAIRSAAMGARSEPPGAHNPRAQGNRSPTQADADQYHDYVCVSMYITYIVCCVCGTSKYIQLYQCEWSGTRENATNVLLMCISSWGDSEPMCSVTSLLLVLKMYIDTRDIETESPEFRVHIHKSVNSISFCHLSCHLCHL